MASMKIITIRRKLLPSSSALKMETAGLSETLLWFYHATRRYIQEHSNLKKSRHRDPHIFLDNRLTDGGEVVSPMRRPPFIPRKIPITHFC
jgi:hypothetical protein